MKHSSLQRILCAILLCFATFYAQAQAWTWATQAIANSSAINPRGMAADATGNYYSCGYRMENPNGPCLGGFWLGKYTPAGTKVYEVVKVASTVSCDDLAVDLAVDLASNRVFVVGSANNLPAILIFNASTGSYLSKINFGGSGSGNISGIDYRGGFIYVIGSYTGQVTITDGGGTTAFTGGGVFVAKFNAASGALVLSKRIYPATTGTLYGYDIKTSNSHGVYISMSTRSNILIQGSTVYTYSSSGFDAVLMSLNSTFNFSWAKQADNYVSGFSRAMPVFFHQPNNTATYLYIGVPRANNDSRLKRYTTTGSLITSITLNRTLLDIAASTCGKVYVTGCTATVNPDLPCWLSNTNLFISCHSQTSLAQEWIMQSSGGCAYGEGIVTDPQGNPVVCGNFSGAGPSILEFGANLSLTAGSRSFVVHLTTNSPCCATGNYALDFDGINDYVQTLSAPLTGNANFTIETWFRTSASNNAFRRVIGWGGTSTRFELGVKNGKLAYYHYPGSMSMEATLTNVVNDNAWHHLAATRNGNTLILYLDGVQVMQKTLANTFNFGTPFCIGRWPGGSNPTGQNWLGQVDEVRVWNVARTLADINTTRYCKPPTASPGLVLHYSFQNLGANSVPNNVLPVNPGTLNNFALIGNTSNWVCSNLFLPACFFSPTVEERIEEEETENTLSSPSGAAILFPNPARQELTIQLAQAATSLVKINVYNLSGQVLRQQTISEGDQSVQMDVSDLPPSLYLVEIQLASGQKEVLKLMKQ